jgi:hypothetical protein
MKKLTMIDRDTKRLAAGITKIGWELVRPALVATSVRRLTGREFSYVDAIVLSFLVVTAGSWLEQGRRSEAEAHDAIVGV